MSLVLRNYRKRPFGFQRRNRAYYRFTYRDLLRRKLQLVRHWKLGETHRFDYANYLRSHNLATALLGTPNYFLLQVSVDSSVALRSLRDYFSSRQLESHIVGHGFVRHLVRYGFGSPLQPSLISGGNFFFVRPKSNSVSLDSLDFFSDPLFQAYRRMVVLLAVRFKGSFIPVSRFESLEQLSTVDQRVFNSILTSHSSWTIFLQQWRHRDIFSQIAPVSA